jgi:hypothetical protein
MRLCVGFEYDIKARWRTAVGAAFVRVNDGLRPILDKFQNLPAATSLAQNPRPGDPFDFAGIDASVRRVL